MLKMAYLSVKRSLQSAWAMVLALVVVANVFGSALAQTSAVAPTESNAAALLEKHVSLADQLANNSYGRPLFLESSESANMVSGNAYAVLDSPFSTVNTTFKSPSLWCEVMILHLNTKYCRATSDTSPSVLKVNIGKKIPQDLKDTFALEFALRLASSSPNYLSVELNAEKGPLGTSNYRIELQAVPLPGNKTFIQFRYSYGYGFTGRLAMQTYLGTIGRGKLGFTQINQDQKSTYVGGMRGAVERNTMRYYLAIDSYLAALNQPPAQQLNARFERWFDATEKYPMQLHEIDKDSYLSMKKSEHQRQQTGTSGTSRPPD